MLTIPLLFFLIFTNPQDSTDYEVSEELSVSFVLLDVSVEDRKGKPITDLKLEDFAISENGTSIPPTYFDILDFRTTVQNDEIATIEKESSQNLQQIILVLDIGTLKLFDAVKMFKQLTYFLESLEKDQAYAIQIYDMDRGSITRGFVDSPNRALAYLNDYRERFNGEYKDKRSGYRPGQGDGGPSYLLGDSDGYGGGYQRRPRFRATTERGNRFNDYEEELKNCFMSIDPQRCIQETLNSYLFEQRARGEAMLGKLELLIDDFKAVDGIKQMMLVSPGFAIDEIQAAHQLANYYAQAGRGFDAAPIDDIQLDFRRVLHAATKRRVIFNTFDIFNTGMDMKRSDNIRTNQRPSREISRIYAGYMRGITRSLRTLAKESGGTFNPGRIPKAMTKVLDRSRYFYVLGYNSPEGKGFRSIKVTCKRKGSKLRYRTGYFGK